MWFTVVTTKEAQNVVNLLAKVRLEIGGKFHIVQSDNGKEFTANIVENFIREHGGTPIHGAPYHPQSQGVVERFHSTVKKIMRKLHKEHPTMSLTQLYIEAVRIYNSSIHSTTKMTPEQAWKLTFVAPEDQSDTVKMGNAILIREQLCVLQKKNAAQNEKRTAKKKMMRKYQVGNFVLVKPISKRLQKPTIFEDVWPGKGEIVGILASGWYEIKWINGLNNEPEGTIGKAHARNIKFSR